MSTVGGGTCYDTDSKHVPRPTRGVWCMRMKSTWRVKRRGEGWHTAEGSRGGGVSKQGGRRRGLDGLRAAEERRKAGRERCQTS